MSSPSFFRQREAEEEARVKAEAEAKKEIADKEVKPKAKKAEK